LLFSLISLIEMSMSVLIAKHFPNDAWQDQITDNGRLEKAMIEFKERKRQNQESDLIDCLQISDKSQILMKAGYSKEWGLKSNSQAKSFFKKLTNLRNNLAHSQKNIWESITDLIATHSKAEKVLEINVELLSKVDVRQK
jgi:uncharacterized protein YjbK